MKRIADFIVDRRKLIMILYAVILIMSLVGMLNVNVNYDMSQYLPEDSFTKAGMKKMSDEYGDLASITVMFDDLTKTEQLQIKEDLASVPNVKSVVYLQDDETYQKDNHSKYMVAVSAGTYSNEAREVLNEIRERYQDYSISVCGAVVDNDLLVATLAGEIPIIAVIVVVIIFIILFLLCDSWVEPFLYMGCIGIAILINMGTNALLPSVSFMTFAVGALLQLGLSMDYSIMLMNRYNQEKLDDPTPVVAMKKALRHAFGAITSSSVTTIVGLLVLVFMSFKIGQDMGIVLAKGVFISLICIFTILPGLVIMFDKAIMKTHKKSLNFKMGFVMKIVTKARYILIPAIVIVVIFAFVQKGGLGIGYVKTFDNEEQQKIENVFGVDNQIVLLYDNSEDEKKITEYIGWLEGQETVNSVQDYSNTIGKSYTYKELVEEMDMTIEQAKLLYQMYRDEQNPSEYEKITMYDLVCYMDENIAGNPSYAEFMSEEELKQIKDAREELEDGKEKIADGKKEIADGEKEITDGEKEISDGKTELAKQESLLNEKEQELSDGETKLAESEAQIADGETQIAAAEAQLAESEAQISEGEKQIAAAEAALAESEKQIADGETQIAAAEAALAESEKQIADGEAQLNAAREQMVSQGLTEEQINEQLREKENELKAAREQLEQGKKELETKKAELKAGREQLEAGKAELASKKQELINGRQQLEAGKAELASKKRELINGRQQLEAGKAELASGRTQIADGRTKISDAKKELEKGDADLENGKKELEEGRRELEESIDIYEKPMTAEELADVMDEEVSDVEEMLKIRRMSMLDVENDTLELEKFVDFITNNVLTNETYAGAITDDMRKDLDEGQKEITENKELMLGETYNRMMVSLALPIEGDETFQFIGQMKEMATDTFEKESYLVGDSTMGYEMDLGFEDELNFVTILTVVAILIVVLLTFRSLIGSASLVAVIQSAVYIVTAIVAMMGISVNYIALILVQCILMGSTIDYGILFMSNYKEIRTEKEKTDAVGIAMDNSIKTIMTSSLILISCCLTVGFIMTQEIIAQTCSVIAYGALCAVILVIFILPALTYMLDRFVVKKERRNG